MFELCAACFVSGVELRDVGHLVTHRYAVAPTLAMPIVPSYVSHLAPPASRLVHGHGPRDTGAHCTEHSPMRLLL